MQNRFKNYYKCANCANEWSTVADSSCNDRCPECRREMTPYKTEDLAPHKCDRCGVVIDEESDWGNCTDCGDDLCPTCAVSFDDEGVCKRCVDRRPSPLERNTLLYTKDGRKVGNAIVQSVRHRQEGLSTLYSLKTDYGDIVELPLDGVKNLFYIGAQASNDHKNSVWRYADLADEAKIIARTEYREYASEDASLDDIEDEDLDVDLISSDPGYLFDGEGFLARDKYGNLLD